MYSLETVNNLAAFHAIRKEWNELLADSTTNNPFLTWEWLYTWCEVLAQDHGVHIIALRQDGRLEAVAPLARMPWRWKRLLPFRGFEFLGGDFVGADYLNFIVRKASERNALPLLLAQMEKAGLMIQLARMDEQAPLTRQVKEAMEHKGFLVSMEPEDNCPCIDLRGHSFESYLQTLGPSHRTNFRRRIRSLRKEFQVTFERAEDDCRRADILTSLIRLHSQRWHGHPGSNALATPALQRFHHRFTRLALQQGWLRLYALRVGNNVAAVLYCLCYGNRYYSYQLGYDVALGRYSPGLCALGQCIEEAIGEGVAEFDFLHAEERYKYLWANGKRTLVRLEGYPPYLKGKIARTAMAARQDIVRHGRRVVM